MSTFVDTSVLIDHTRGLHAAHDALSQAAERGDLHSSEMVRAELLLLIRERELEAIAPLLEASVGCLGMADNPWTSREPQPGDFDRFLDSVDPADRDFVQVHEGRPNSSVRLMVSLGGDDAELLQKRAVQRGQDIDSSAQLDAE